ncbi:Transposon Ty3-I Gag-Pol poly [Clarias magur]|uniref:Transposon Ty3-I Gag-Pol poly n=1 Tax=Clarias magur TaxID=1594786 RepID=A0A8J4TLV4_CLAMG|nr:Transposon Ty3-I Gag-Pol poly [Clarias magur]
MCTKIASKEKVESLKDEVRMLWRCLNESLDLQRADNQEHVWRGILDHVQAPGEPFPTFVAHLLSEFKKLMSPPPEQEQIDLICKHALEHYRVALYDQQIASVIDLLMCAHDLHSALDPDGQDEPQAQKSKQAIICGLDLRNMFTVMITDREQFSKLQKDDQGVAQLLKNLEDGGVDGGHVLQDGLLYFKDPKVACGLHHMKQLKLVVPAVLQPTVTKYYHHHPTAGHLNKNSGQAEAEILLA